MKNTLLHSHTSIHTEKCENKSSVAAMQKIEMGCSPFCETTQERKCKRQKEEN